MPVVTRWATTVLSCLGLTAAALPLVAQAQVRAAAPTAACRLGQRDDFTGATLDRTRWTTVMRETQDLRVVDGALVIPTTNTDLLWPDDPNLTQNIVLRALPPGPFTATAKLALAPRTAFQQAGLVVYGDDDNYIKLVFQVRGTNDVESRRFEFLGEAQGKAGANLSPKLGAGYPDAVWVRLTSDGTTLRAAYSADGQQFTEIPETERSKAPSLAGMAKPKIGLLAMAGTGTGAPVIEAKFDWFELCPVQGPAR